jgi:diguanylate cyclase (GGDEF)-like protein
MRHVRSLILSAAERDDALRNALRLLQPVLGSDAAVALLFNDQDHSFRITEQCGLSARQRRGLSVVLPSLAEFASREGIPGFPAKNNGGALIFTEAESRPSGISSAFVYYLVRSERIVGALAFCRKQGQFDKLPLKVLDSVGSLVGLLAENKLYREKAHDIAGFVNLDGLTGLFNHRYFQENLSSELLKSQRFRYKVSVLMIDIDHFKSFNDLHGHPAGDAVLAGLADFFKAQMRGGDIVCRYGGEEFTLILPECSLEDAGERIAHMIEEVKKLRIKYGNRSLGPITLSAGVAAYPQNGGKAEDLLRAADTALFRAKEEGRDRVVLAT